MDGVAQASPKDRADLFQQATIQLQPARSPVIIEKDFWVCWTLLRVFEVMRFQPQLMFKGGTSLSKAYQLAYSDPSRPLIPTQVGHPFRRNAATDSEGNPATFPRPLGIGGRHPSE